MARTKKAPVPFNLNGKFAHLVGKQVKMTSGDTVSIGVYLGEKFMCGSVPYHTVRETCNGQKYSVECSVGDWANSPVSIEEVKL